MEHPRTPGAGVTRAGKLGGNSSQSIRRLAPAVQRLHSDLRLQIAFRHLHRCGPRPTAMCFAELCDAYGINPAALDFVLTWCRFDPAVVAAIAGEFPRLPLDLVPAA